MTLHKLLYALISLFSLFSVLAQTSGQVKSYIIHVKQHDRNIHTTNYHNSFLPAVTTSNDPLLYSYNHVISGFAARLTAEEVEAMKEKDGFISAHPERMYQLSTTRSPSFLGLHPGTGLWNQSNEGKGVIIGVLDTGVFPSHPSFSGVNMPPPPAKWKGKCKFPNKTNCNNKLIGARFFNRASKLDDDSPLDQHGHGTHTASTAAGGFVENACVLGSACGTAVGMAPQAHLAIYKVCSQSGCSNIDILAGLDAAIKDGVDVVSYSLTHPSIPFHDDPIAIGTFAAAQKGVFVSCAGGNGGPFKQSIVNEAPWVLTVGASTIDRRLRATAKLGNGQVFDGESVYQPKDFPAGKMLPLVYGASCCKLSDVKEKVVFCYGTEDINPLDQGWEVKDAGGAATILANPEHDGFTTYAEAHVLPATEVSYMAGQNIKAYINSTKSPMATILFKGTVIGDPLAPVVASLSSRGPSLQTPGVLKPDIIGPGMNILAAWPFHFDADTSGSKLTFNIISDTSTSTSHLSGVAALIKRAHPNWSPAAIKSAIMTTAGLVSAGRTAILDEKLTPADVFATGAGHVNPSNANDPGLVYDLEPDDYIPFLCGLGYTDEQVGKIAHKSVSCTSKIPQGQLNYPTFSVSLGSSQTFKRTVTNVGEPFSYYFAKIVSPKGVKIIVKPRQLQFSSANQKAKYYVTFSRCGNLTNTYSQGYLQWVSRKHTVTSAISVEFTGEA
ncbi:subtilisin-like protease sdd1 [Phtheirospermum japonicum]|uniref:Subtilisin-like protease sdd1 n=1 Tax=Phtheirospermum japonicum TaxID=374723 RepID=A0A830B974_9LAMI|nr:subtilisin-like protease sdd1 [Phtheirospermum japonicum]